MLFNSLDFLLFYAIFFSIFFYLRQVQYQVFFIAIACIYFYGSWRPSHIPLILFVCFSSYLSQMNWSKRSLLAPSIVLMLSVLFFFKYYAFFRAQVQFIGLTIPSLDVVLPIGISFYTFHAISFAVDRKRGTVGYEENFPNIVAYISFFPQLVAGPIVRAGLYLPQLRSVRIFNRYMFRSGLLLFAVGMFKKVVIADNLGVYVDQIYRYPGIATAGSHWLAFYLYAIQIYYDFSGYSDMAIGIARTLGYRFPVNFNRPYLSASVTEFWRRWHISLSSWLRDYLYIPLGGNRRGSARTYLNLLIVMFLGGLWHGAAWTFVAWGVLHGMMLMIERALMYRPTRGWTRCLGVFGTVQIVCISWVFFRSRDFGSAAAYFQGMLDLDTLTTLGTKFTVVKVFFLSAVFILIEIFSVPRTFFCLRKPSVLGAASVIYIALFLLIGCFSSSPFIYFQF